MWEGVETFGVQTEQLLTKSCSNTILLQIYEFFTQTLNL